MKKETNLKKSKSVMIIGIIMFVLAVICLVLSIVSFVQAKKAYDVAYDQWHDNWFVHHTAELSDKPKATYLSKIILIFLSGGFAITSIIVTLIGISPYVFKFGHKIKTITDTFNIKECGIHEEKQDSQANTTNKKKVCGFCGAKLDKNSSTCNYCGKDN